MKQTRSASGRPRFLLGKVVTALLASGLIASIAVAGTGPIDIDLENARIGRRPLGEHSRLEFRVVGTPDGLSALFNCHDRNNFAFLHFDGTNATLYEVVDGRQRRLPVSLPIASDGALFIRPGRVLLRLGDRQAAADLSGPPGGRYAWAGGTFEELTPRHSGTVFFTDDFMREEGTGEYWRPLSGRWAVRSVSDPERSANPFRCVARADGVGLMTTGEPHWHAYEASASVQARDGKVGLVFAKRSPDDYHLFRMAVDRGASELVHVRDGSERVLARTSRALYPDQWYRLAVRTDGDGIACFVGDETLLRSEQVAAIGRVGLYVLDAEETLIDDVRVRSSHIRPPSMGIVPLISETFETDREMENWASLASSWQSDSAGAPRAASEFSWHKGEFFGDLSIGYAPREAEEGAALFFVIGADGSAANAGALLEARQGTEGSVLTISVAGESIASAAGAPLGGSGQVTFRKSGDLLIAEQGGRTVLEAGPVELAGQTIGIGSAGLELDLREVELRSNNAHDYLFQQAPVEWFARTGIWAITTRWECDPRWSWMGGHSKQVAQMWSRRSFQGDQVVEFFGALQHQEGRDRYPHLGDINLTICGDGRNLDSGYQVIFAGWGNRWTRLLRNGEIVAGSGDHVMPARSGQFREIHRRWFHIKLRKSGDLIQLYLDGQLVREFRDPEPIEGGHVALWTVNNAMMVARTRIYAERSELHSFLKDGTPPSIEPQPMADPPSGYLVRTAFDQTLGGLETLDGAQGADLELRPEGGLLAINRNSGGSFGVSLYRREFNLRDYPTVRLAWTAVSDEPVRLNLFARVNGRLLELPLAAPPESSVAFRLAGGPTASFHGEPGSDHHIEIDLEGIVTEWYRGRTGDIPERLMVTDLFLANASNRDYLMCGFGGNRAGARVLFTEFAIRANE